MGLSRRSRRSSVREASEDGPLRAIERIDERHPQLPEVQRAAEDRDRARAAATAEFDRQLDSLLHPPCPPGLECEQQIKRFDVPGIPGSAGVNTTQTIKNQPGSLHPDVLRADAIVFRDDAFVEQVFLGTERPIRHRAGLIRAAQELYQQGS